MQALRISSYVRIIFKNRLSGSMGRRNSFDARPGEATLFNWVLSIAGGCPPSFLLPSVPYSCFLSVGSASLSTPSTRFYQSSYCPYIWILYIVNGLINKQLVLRTDSVHGIDRFWLTPRTVGDIRYSKSLFCHLKLHRTWVPQVNTVCSSNSGRLLRVNF